MSKSTQANAKATIVLGVVVALSLFIIAIIYPMAGSQHSTSYTCVAGDPLNCSWGQTYDPTYQMTELEATIWGNLPVFVILVLLLAFVGVGLKAIGII